MLHKLENPVVTTIVKRPSAVCKTPYVADICVSGENVLAHCPALGCSGLSENGSTVLLCPMKSKNTKCSYSVELAIFEEKGKQTIVGINPKMAETIVSKSLENNYVGFLKDQTDTKREVKYLNSRFDFTGVDKNGRPYIMEIKNVPLADYVDVPKKERKKYKNIENTKQYNEKISYFPDGYRKNNTDIVSPRALKHIEELTTIATTTDYRTILCFVIQRTDVMHFQPSAIDPTYRAAVQNAWKKGVEIRTIQVEWNIEGQCTYVSDSLPIMLFDEFGPYL